MNKLLTQDELAQLGAYLDGELSQQEASQVRNRIASEASWAQAARELQALDEALDLYVAPPASEELANRIIAASRKLPSSRPLSQRVIRILAPLAAAAAVVVGLVFLYNAPAPTTNSSTVVISEPPKPADTGDVDNLVIENLDFFKNYKTVEAMASTDQLADDLTLQAIDRLEGRPEGTL